MCGGRRQEVKAAACGAAIRGFESPRSPFLLPIKKIRSKLIYRTNFLLLIKRDIELTHFLQVNLS